MNFPGVEIHFYHTTAVRPPPEPLPCEEAIWGKLLFLYYFSFRSTYFYFNSSRDGWSILIFEELLIGSTSFSIVLGFFLPVLCLASQVALYGWLTLTLFLGLTIISVIAV
ncbi:unnamed protein product [Cuscuta epithymum]|uniref:Transmembrane protein n=1 Tax=Cuscuta epithymum TaxID=186058 RepID=A0AAV0FIT3_9ASTE|nr:unnamed protein product [Cuscuta epithymum]